MATNVEMIQDMAMLAGIEYDGENLKTFAEWKKAGYSVKKGEKAVLKVDLWKPFERKLKDQEGKVIMENGKPKTETSFMLKASHLFHTAQVEKAKKAPTKKRTYKKKKTA